VIMKEEKTTPFACAITLFFGATTPYKKIDE
jgi:hypothetical protein